MSTPVVLTAICSHCGRPVRSTLELDGEAADLRELLALLPMDRVEALKPLLADYVRHLDSELAGDHADCFLPLRLQMLHLERMSA